MPDFILVKKNKKKRKTTKIKPQREIKKRKG